MGWPLLLGDQYLDSVKNFNTLRHLKVLGASHSLISLSLAPKIPHHSGPKAEPSATSPPHKGELAEGELGSEVRTGFAPQDPRPWGEGTNPVRKPLPSQIPSSHNTSHNPPRSLGAPREYSNHPHPHSCDWLWPFKPSHAPLKEAGPIAAVRRPLAPGQRPNAHGQLRRTPVTPARPLVVVTTPPPPCCFYPIRAPPGRLAQWSGDMLIKGRGGKGRVGVRRVVLPNQEAGRGGVLLPLSRRASARCSSLSASPGRDGGRAACQPVSALPVPPCRPGGGGGVVWCEGERGPVPRGASCPCFQLSGASGPAWGRFRGMAVSVRALLADRSRLGGGGSPAGVEWMPSPVWEVQGWNLARRAKKSASKVGL